MADTTANKEDSGLSYSPGVTTLESLPPSRFNVLGTWSPAPCLHPTEATIQDNQTGKIYHWNSRAHRKMRFLWSKDEAEQGARTGLKLWCCEPHLVSWWNVISNMTANVFWVLNGTYNLFPYISPNSAQVTYAGAVLGGFFLITTNYLSLVEAINNTSCDVRTSDRDDKKKHKRVFKRPKKVYGKFKSPIGFDRHVIDQHKFCRELQDLGFPYIESVETKQLLTADDYDKAIQSSIGGKEASMVDESSIEMPQTSIRDSGEAKANASEEGTAISSSLIGKEVNIVDSNFCSTTQVINIVQTKPSSSQSYQWFTLHPPFQHIGVLTSFIGVWCALLYMIPMCISYPWSQRTDISQGKELFFYDLLQGLTHTFYALTAHAAVAEAAGSWWKPKPSRIGWYVAMFNVIGSWGFALCGYFLIPGTVGASCCGGLATGSSWCCFIGAWSYFVGGLFQMVEFANPNPIVLCGKKRSLD